MRNIPVDTSALSFVCVVAPRPKLVNQDTGEVKVDRNGQTVYQVGLSAANESGRVEVINVAISGDPGVQIGQIVTPYKLTAFPWEQTRDGVLRWGIAFRADSITATMSATADPAAA